MVKIEIEGNIENYDKRKKYSPDWLYLYEINHKGVIIESWGICNLPGCRCNGSVTYYTRDGDTV